MSEHTTVRRSMTEAARDQSAIYTSSGAGGVHGTGRVSLVDLVAGTRGVSTPSAPRPKTNKELGRELEERAPDEVKRNFLRGALIAAGAGAVGAVVGAQFAGAAPSDSLRIRDDYIQFKGLTAHPSPPPEGGEWYIGSLNKWFGSPDGVNVVPVVGSHGVSTGGNTLGDTGVSPGRVVFQGGNNVTLSQLTAASGSKTVIIQAAAGGGGGVAVSAGTQLGSSGTIAFVDSNGLTFGMSNSSQVTGSYTRPVAGAAIQNVSSVTGSGTATSRFAAEDHAHLGLVSAGVSTGGNSSGDTTVAPGYVVFQGGNSITLSQVTGAGGAKTIVISGPSAGAETPFGISAGTQSVSTGTVAFSNSNNVTFGMSNSNVVTASASFPPETPFGVSAGTQSVSTGTLVFSNSNNVTFGMSGSGTVTASASYSQSTAPGAVSAGTQQATSGTVVFANSNGLTFGMSNSSQITASYTVPSETPFGISAGTQSVSTGTLIFSNSNNVTFGMSGSSQVTASASFAAQTFLGAIAAGTQTATSGTVAFVDSNGMTFGMSASTRITASYTVPAVPVVSNAIQSVSSATGSGTNTSRFAADDHVHAGVGPAGVSTGGNTSGSTAVLYGQMVLVGGNSITLSQSTDASNRMTITISGATTAQTAPVVSNALQDVSTATGSGTNTSRFAADDHVHRGVRAMVASGTASSFYGNVVIDSGALISLATGGASTAGSIQIINLLSSATTASQVTTANVVGAMASRVALEGHQHQGLHGLIASGTASTFVGDLTVNSGNMISFATAGNSTSGSLSIIDLWSSATTASRDESINVVGAMASRAALEGHQHAALWALNVGGNTSGTTSSGAGSFQVAGGPNVTVSGSTAAGGETLSISAGGTMTQWFDPIMHGSYTPGQLGAQTSVIVPLFIPEPLQVDRLLHWISFSLSTSTNSSHAGNVSLWAGIYTRNASTLSLATSGSQTYQWSNTSNNSSQSLQGFRMLSIPMAATMTPGNYWLGFVSNTTSTNANWFTMSNVMVTRFNTVYSGSFLSATNASMQKMLGSGSFSAVTTGARASIAFSDIRDAGVVLWQSTPVLIFASSTV